MRNPDASVEAANRIRHTRREVLNAGSYYIGERSPPPAASSAARIWASACCSGRPTARNKA